MKLNSSPAKEMSTALKFGPRLKLLRGKKTQAEFAKALGVTQQALANWEIGNRQPKLDDLVRIATYLNVSTDYLLGVAAHRYSYSIVYGHFAECLCNAVQIIIRGASRPNEAILDCMRGLRDEEIPPEILPYYKKLFSTASCDTNELEDAFQTILYHAITHEEYVSWSHVKEPAEETPAEETPEGIEATVRKLIKEELEARGLEKNYNPKTRNISVQSTSSSRSLTGKGAKR